MIFNIYKRIFFSFCWRYGKLKFIFNKIKFGNNLVIFGSIYLDINQDSYIEIGDNCTIKSGLGYNPISRNIKSSITSEYNSKLIIGNNFGMSSSCIWVHNSITIGDNVIVGADTIIVDSNCHSLNFLNRRMVNLDLNDKLSDKIIIGNDVFIGTRCIILKGVTIGSRSIIGSGSVVVNDVEPDSIYAGNPAFKIRDL
jgi:acetyltransferase-like isoleucine patch superfamily enzyme